MDILDQDISINEKDLLVTIWTKPRLTLEYILQNCPHKYVNILLLLTGVVNAINLNYRYLVDNKAFSIILFLIVLVLGGIFGWLVSYLYAALLSWTGEWLGGEANVNQYITVIAWSSIPSICSLVLLIPYIIMMGDNEPGAFLTILSYLTTALESALSIWTVVILVKGISQIQKFKIGKAVLNACLPVLVIAIPILVIAGIVYIFK